MDLLASPKRVLHRQWPHDLEAEQGALGCILTNPSICLPESMKTVHRDSFYDLRHQIVFESMMEFSNAPATLDVITLQQHLRQRNVLEQVGGIAYLARLQDGIPSAANLPCYLDIISEKHTLRRVLQFSGRIESQARDETPIEEMLAMVEREALALRPRQRQSSVTLRDLAPVVLEEVEMMWSRDGGISGLATGFPDLDRICDGLHGGEMIVLAGYPGDGKSALALNIATQAALQKHPSAYYSAEMTARELAKRATASEARVNLYDFRDKTAGEGDFTRFAAAVKTLVAAPLLINVCNSASIHEIAAMARRDVQTHGLKLIVVDYLQRLNCPGKDNREQEIAAISSTLKSVALELNVPIIALSQLNDDGKLRESRAIGQDADTIWLLQANEKKTTDQPTTLKVVKNRAGPTGDVQLLFRKQWTRFESGTRFDH